MSNFLYGSWGWLICDFVCFGPPPCCALLWHVTRGATEPSVSLPCTHHQCHISRIDSPEACHDDHSHIAHVLLSRHVVAVYKACHHPRLHTAVHCCIRDACRRSAWRGTAVALIPLFIPLWPFETVCGMNRAHAGVRGARGARLPARNPPLLARRPRGPHHLLLGAGVCARYTRTATVLLTYCRCTVSCTAATAVLLP